MFDRFTLPARRVVVSAQEESRALDHTRLGIEHLILGVLSDGEGIAADALAGFDVSLEAARQVVVEVVGRGEAASPPGHIPMTPRAFRALEFSFRESPRLGHEHIGPEHLVLGVIRWGEGDAGERVLVGLGVEPELLRVGVVGMMQR